MLAEIDFVLVENLEGDSRSAAWAAAQSARLSETDARQDEQACDQEAESEARTDRLPPRGCTYHTDAWRLATAGGRSRETAGVRLEIAAMAVVRRMHAASLTMVRFFVKSFPAYLRRVLKDSTVNALCAAVSRALKKERLRKKLSMSAVAERGGLSQQMVSYVERDMRKPTLDTIFRMSLALEVDPAKLIRDATKSAS